ncbi:MAG TPA: BrnA antitoxin family protein [Allosphingosinicella sp.]|nr:BrnA antitoxin family protein [Allosphingosinicella sp.]
MNGKSTISGGPDADDAPLLTREIAERAQLAVGERVIRPADPPLGRRRGRPARPAGEKKEAVSLRLSPAVLAFFRAGGAGWQTRVDEALMRHVRDAGAGGAVAEERAGYRAGGGEEDR